MKKYRKFVDELRTRLEEMNALKANEEVILDTFSDEEEPTARIILSDDGDMVNGIAVRLNKLIYLEEDEDWMQFLNVLNEKIRYARSLEDSFYKVNRDNKYWATAKERLIVRPVHYDDRFEKDCEKIGFVYKQVGDIALVVYLIVKDDGDVLSTAKLAKGLAETWAKDGGISIDDIYSQAFKNTQERYKPRLYTDIFDIENAPLKKCALMENGYTVKELSDYSCTLLTTSKKTNGAIAMWYDGVAKKISELYGGSSFYAAFTSVHEAMIHKVGTISVDSIRRNVTSTNKIFGPDDTLSNLVWFYNAEDKTFTAVEE